MIGISVINFKGGVGKTTISWLLSKYISTALQEKILLFDLDAQMSLTHAAMLERGNGTDFQSWYTEYENSEYTLPKFISRFSQDGTLSYKSSKLVYTMKNNRNLSFIPSTEGLYGIEFETDYTKMKPFIKGIVRKITKNRGYKYIIFDCAPNFTPLNYSALNYSNVYLVPINPDIFAMKGVNILINTLKPKIDYFEKKKICIFMNKAKIIKNKITNNTETRWLQVKEREYQDSTDISFLDHSFIPERVGIHRSIFDSDDYQASAYPHMVELWKDLCMVIE